MKLIKRLPDNVVVYAGDDLTLTPESASGSGWQDFGTTKANAVLDDGTLPAGWTGGAWSYAGGIWTCLFPALIPIPQTVTAYQAEMALLNAGYYTPLMTWLGTQPPATQITFNRAQNFSRKNTTLNAGATALGLTGAQVDALLIAASLINPNP